MSFTRKALSAIQGLTAEQIEAIYTLHGTSLSDYVTKADAESAQAAAIAEALKTAPKINGMETEEYKALQKEFDGYKLSQTLTTEYGVKGKFAQTVANMLDTSKDTKEQIETIKETYEEYFSPTDTTPETVPPIFGTKPEGSMPTGNAKPTLSDIWFGKK